MFQIREKSEQTKKVPDMTKNKSKDASLKWRLGEKRCNNLFPYISRLQKYMRLVLYL